VTAWASLTVIRLKILLDSNIMNEYTNFLVI
jgi:hypothetical protein